MRYDPIAEKLHSIRTMIDMQGELVQTAQDQEEKTGTLAYVLFFQGEIKADLAELEQMVCEYKNACKNIGSLDKKDLL